MKATSLEYSPQVQEAPQVLGPLPYTPAGQSSQQLFTPV